MAARAARARGRNGSLTVVCDFCNRSYSRRDALRRHQPVCPDRGSRPVDSSARPRGRARHSCDRCVDKKLHCDGRKPCGTCVVKSAICSNITSRDGPSRSASQDPEARVQRHRSESFLLRDEEEEVFSARFNFPRPPTAEQALQEPEHEHAHSHAHAHHRDHDHDLGSPSLVDFDFNFLDNVFYPAFFASTSWSGAAPVAAEVLYNASDTTEYVAVNLDAYSVSSHLERLAGVPRAIMDSAHARKSSQAINSNALANLEHIFTAKNLVRHVNDYFRYWHRNSRVVHRPSFTLGHVSDPLLVGVVLLGAMYSSSQNERRMAGSVMQYAEEYIFEQVPIVPRNECIRHNQQDENTLQSIQACLCMIVIQFWTGDAQSQHRTMTLRFGQVIEASYHMDLLRTTHTLEDRVSERAWLDVETRIRAATYLTLLDCAFLFFRGIPLRILSPEIECDFPCDEAVFDAEHPFTLPQFCFERTIGPKQAFKWLFKANTEPGEKPPDLTMLDTFILIHMLYRFTNDTLTLCTWGPRSSKNILARSTDIRLALDTWHKCWKLGRDRAQEQGVWDNFGFWKNGDQYETATRLLLSQATEPNIARLLASHVDRLNLLKQLTIPSA